MPRTNMRDLSFATFNLLNLQVPGGLTYSRTPPFPDDEQGRAAYARKIEWSAQAVLLLDAEIIGFQELWSTQALLDVFERAGLAGQYDIVARDAPGIGRPQVALAVRKNRRGQPQLLPGAHWIADFPERFRFDGLRETEGAEEEITITINEFSRPVLRAEIRAEGESPRPPVVTCFVAHLKSKGPARLSFAQPQPVVLEAYPAITGSAVAHIRRERRQDDATVALDIKVLADDVRAGEYLVDMRFVDTGGNATRIVGNCHRNMDDAKMRQRQVGEFEPSKEEARRTAQYTRTR